MLRRVRFCFYSTDQGTAQSIRNALDDTLHLRVIKEVSDWPDLRDFLDASEVEMVLVNLDPDPQETLQVVQQLVRLVPDMGILGVSASTDPQSIIQAMRAGCTQFVCSPVDTADLNNAVARIQATRKHVDHTSRRICVVGSAGGVGVTTIACNLALELAHLTERPSALVDLNLEFGDVACAFDCKPAYSVADLCRTGTELDRTMVESAMHVLPCDVHLLGRPEQLQDAHEVAPESVEKLLEMLGGTYANVVIDLPRGFSFFSAVAIERADLVLIIAQLTVHSVRNASRIYELLRHMGADIDRLEVVLNRCKAEFERITPEDVEKHFARPVFGMIPNDYRRVAASLDLGNPSRANAPKNSACVAIQNMAKKIASELQGVEAVTPQPRGLFGRLWGKKESARQ
jgi:pilus assembly protein CpaE